MSGSTQVSQCGRYYRMTLMTPSIHFAIDPSTGSSQERDYHDRAGTEFQEQLVSWRPRLEEAVEAVRREEPLLEFDEALPVAIAEYPSPSPDGPCLMAFWVGGARLELAFNHVLPQAAFDRVTARLRELLAV